MKEFLTNKDLLEIWESYDAYYFANKYGEASTHRQQFTRLYGLLGDDELSNRALRWIKDCYDCYYRASYEERNKKNNPFYYLQCKLNDLESKGE